MLVAVVAEGIAGLTLRHTAYQASECSILVTIHTCDYRQLAWLIFALLLVDYSQWVLVC